MYPWFDARFPSIYTAGLLPCGTAFFGMVMLANPTVPLGPVIIKENTVSLFSSEVVGLYIISCAVTFPMISSSTFLPSTVADIIVVSGFAVGIGVGVGEAVG